MKSYWILLMLLISSQLAAQTGIIKGRVFDPINNDAVPFANVIVQGTQIGTATDIDGKFELAGLVPGTYNIEVSFLGYVTRIISDIEVNNARAAVLEIELKESELELDEVVIQTSAFNKTSESPVSLRTIGVNEIKRYPGGNRDISKVIQSLPGVGTTVSFRNDVLIRGGSPSENRFYLDGIETPIINHFATQGASGGPVGLINVDFIREVDFYSGAFPANRGNALSSIMDIKMKDGRDDKLGFTFTIGASETGLSLEGPVGKKSTFILSVRRSYLQFLFKLIELPFLPTYTDFQFKNKIRFNDKNELTILGLGSYDQFDLNLDANETEDQLYILNNIPENGQWSYTIGAKHTLFRDNSYWTFVASRNHLNNFAVKYINNDDSNPSNLNFDYQSEEIENKLRVENTARFGGYRINVGAGYEFATYTNTSFVKSTTPTGLDTFDFTSKVNFNKYGLFASVSKAYLKERLDLSLGFRIDGTDYSEETSNPFSQFSPRFSLAYTITPGLSFNFNTGIYYQLPPYTALGFRNNEGVLANKENGLKYLNNKHLVAGLEYVTAKNSKFSIEGFYKKYDDYPFLLTDSISLANLGGDFGVIGNDPINSTSEGRSYGGEFLFQQRLFKGYYGIVSYTIFRSEFKDKNGQYVSSAWDTRHIISLTGGKKFKKNWEIGARYRISGGSPFTPINIPLSSLKPVWDANQQGIPEYNLLNTERLSWFHQLDIRIDKKFFFKKFTLDIYLDIENLYNQEAQLPSVLTVERDGEGFPLEDPMDAARYDTYLLENSAGQLLPTFGLIFSR